MLNVIFCGYDICHVAFYCWYAGCRYAECRYAECCYAECRYAECRGAVKVTQLASGETRISGQLIIPMSKITNSSSFPKILFLLVVCTFPD